MNAKANKSRASRRGAAFITVLLMTAVLETFLGVSMFRLIQEQKLLKFNEMKTQTFYAAQGALEIAAQQLAINVADFTIQNWLDSFTDENGNPAGVDVNYTDDGNADTSTFSARYRVTEIAGSQGQIFEDGVTKSVRSYTIAATADHPNQAAFSQSMFIGTPTDAATSANVNQVVQIKASTLYQYMAFYNDDLEILPGPSMTLGGKVHSNKDIYLGAGNGSVLRVDTDFLHAVGTIYNHRKNNSNTMPGTVTIKEFGASSYTDMTFDAHDPDWASLSQSTWGGTVKDVNQNVQVITPLGIPPITPGGFYDTNAGLNIKKVGGQFQVRDAGGNDVSSCLPAGAITESTFNDFREGGNVTVTNIDISLLNASGCFPSNGVIYAARDDSAAGTPNGIRLVNGSAIGSQSGANNGMTFVTNAPLYVQGDFNNVNKKPVALISDSLNILSNSWDDANSWSGKSSRVASDTTVNAAFTSGVNVTTPGNYNGGLENYPRFHETWSGKDLNILGSFIGLWDSQTAQGSWDDASYSPPRRNWFYDQDLISDPPPMTPLIVEVENQSWWQEAKDSIYL